ncbi:MAG: mechanosensitive ion channel family protein [Methanoculleus sp.]|uniref:mechanosensitive ion channel family protein n=1 Tax=Methanoculleus sp. TaxID=90427 RepID=UPI0025F7AD48|nr:mechanosensitive ion channel family protein [Methanoculleus sp.]MCK9318374.1 mechanosensitive ion channel family protein [Methanoculleus sp.]MDD2254938.1 mechanosensitive ion channel family protein [Methanoculleus sp.]MDD3217236.1 mechanosensitive ion channel family protein [Methanoculleus sp.]MDD4315200.1 mechanosensitive ion channel family protein [Methanoculleus sp.]MDD4471800.1 mechanosensitive ion channel family protein [Methanoculleus sp.]
MSFNVTEIFEIPIGIGNITVENLLYFAVILIIGVTVARVVSTNVRRALLERLPKNERELLTKLVYYVIILWAFVIALPQLHFDLSGLLVAGGIAGLVIGFASQSVVSNLISGLFLMFEHPIKIGDNINVSDVSGSVEDVRVLSTVIKTYDGLYIRIPNETVFTSNITNYVHNAARRFEYQIGIRYEDDADAAIRIAKEVIATHPFALKSPAPSVFVDNLGDNSVNLTAYIWAPARNWWDVRTDLLWKIKQALEANGIEMPFPQRTLTFADGLEVRTRAAGKNEREE